MTSSQECGLTGFQTNPLLGLFLAGCLFRYSVEPAGETSPLKLCPELLLMGIGSGVLKVGVAFLRTLLVLLFTMRFSAGLR